jgi:uncharacterized membrane protein (UPF0182 family)
VLVSYGPKVGYGATLQEALDQIFGAGTGEATTTPPQAGQPTTTPTTPTTTPTTTPPNTGGGNAALDKAVTDIQSALAKLRAAQQSGNFTDQGAALAALDAAAKEYEAAKTAAPGTSTPPPSSQPGG